MLKQSTLFSLRAAEAFVFEHGTPWQQAFWRASFGWGPVEVFLFELDPFFQEDGSWEPAFAQSDCPLEAACLGLMLLGNLNLGEDIFEMGPRAFNWIASQQGQDGYWRTSTGDRNSLSLSVALANALKYRGEHTQVVDKGLASLVKDSAALLVDPIACTHWLSLTHGHSAPDIQDRYQAAYEQVSQYTQDQGSVPQVAYHAHMMAQRCRLAIHDPIRDTAWQRLVESQASDGGWHDHRGIFFRVLTTLFAARSVVSR